MEPLSSAEKKQLRGAAQRLSPIVRIGRNGLSAGVIQELETGLDRDQLIKVRFDGNRLEIERWIEQISGRTGAECVGAIGKTASFYRPAPPGC